MIGAGRINAFKTLSGTSGIPEEANESFSLIYPNPNNGTFTILSENADAIREVHLTDLSGKQVKQIVPSFVQKEMLLSLNLAPGMYALSLISEEKVENVLVRVR